MHTVARHKVVSKLRRYACPVFSGSEHAAAEACEEDHTHTIRRTKQ